MAKGKIKIVDKITTEELAAQEIEKTKVALIAQAQKLLSDNDYRQIKATLNLYTPEKAQAVFNYTQALREVIKHARNGILTDLPTATF